MANFQPQPFRPAPFRPQAFAPAGQVGNANPPPSSSNPPPTFGQNPPQQQGTGINPPSFPSSLQPQSQYKPQGNQFNPQTNVNNFNNNNNNNTAPTGPPRFTPAPFNPIAANTFSANAGPNNTGYNNNNNNNQNNHNNGINNHPPNFQQPHLQPHTQRGPPQNTPGPAQNLPQQLSTFKPAPFVPRSFAPSTTSQMTAQNNNNNPSNNATTNGFNPNAQPSFTNHTAGHTNTGPRTSNIPINNINHPQFDPSTAQPHPNTTGPQESLFTPMKPAPFQPYNNNNNNFNNNNHSNNNFNNNNGINSTNNNNTGFDSFMPNPTNPSNQLFPQSSPANHANKDGTNNDSTTTGLQDIPAARVSRHLPQRGASSQSFGVQQPHFGTFMPTTQQQQQQTQQQQQQQQKDTPPTFGNNTTESDDQGLMTFGFDAHGSQIPTDQPQNDANEFFNDEANPLLGSQAMSSTALPHQSPAHPPPPPSTFQPTNPLPASLGAQQQQQQPQQQQQQQPQRTHPLATPANPWPQYAHEDDVPILEELGVDLSIIFVKTAQLLRLRFDPNQASSAATTTSNGEIDGSSVVDDMNKKSAIVGGELISTEYDLTGPLVYCLLLGVLLMVLQQKIHFGYIYGYNMIGSLCLWFLCNVLSDFSLSIDVVLHVLGYSLAPLLVLPMVNFLLTLSVVDVSYNVLIVQVVSFLLVLYSTIIATRYLEFIMQSESQRYIIGYPVMLFFICFAILILF